MTPKGFGETAKGLARNPLGVIALFLVLVYALASLVLGVGSHLTSLERLPMVWFLVVFPLLVLGVFTLLVTRHHPKLYAPSDFEDDDSFLALAQRQTRAMSAVRLAVLEKTVGGTGDLADTEARVAAQAVSALEPRALRSAGGRGVLWVDDRPENNRYERQALEALGILVTTASSTEAALMALQQQSFDAIITDMGRPPDERAGYTLAERVQQMGVRLPMIIYAGSSNPKHRAESQRRGFFGNTNRPDELVVLVIKALRLTTPPEREPPARAPHVAMQVK